MANDILLKVEGLRASVEDKEILKGVDLVIRKGEIHAVMGPNGAGKSTLSAVLAGKPQFTVTAGKVEFMGQDLLAMSPEERAWAGLFLSFQYPVEIPGVTITNFMKTAVNAHRTGKGLEPLKAGDFLKLLREKMAFVQMKPEFAKREVNVGFSGGEKKRNEIFQMAMLDPVLAILDETDSGCSPVEYLDRLGVLGPDVIAAHTLWLSDRDIEILGRRGVNCVHNVNSNLKLASGYRFLYNELRDAGANICLGTDGCASSNNLDMLETIKTSAMIQKAWRKDSSAMPLDELMSMATVNAGKALGLNIGRIEEGALADMLLVDTENYNFLSPGSFEANLIYSAHSDCINSVICGGKFVMRNRVVPGEKEILDKARKMLHKLI